MFCQWIQPHNVSQMHWTEVGVFLRHGQGGVVQDALLGQDVAAAQHAMASVGRADR